MLKLKKFVKPNKRCRLITQAKLLILLFTIFPISYSITGQQYLPLNSETNLFFQKSNYKNSSFHSNIKPFLLSDSLRLFYGENKGNKLLDDNLAEIKKEAFSVSINPIVRIEPCLSTDSSEIYGNYQLGVSAGGNFRKNIAFRFDAFYGISSFLPYLSQTIDSTGIVPQFGEYLSKRGKNYHYLNLSGYVSYSPWKELNLQAGVGKNFFGEGYRSLFLSDNSASYPYFKTTVDVWKFKYIWMFGALKDPDSEFSDGKFRNKLLFTHYLSWNATKWLNLNFFESIVSNPVDSLGVTYFNVNYLNPVIFLRPIEFSGGSADNALLGFGGKIKLFKKFHFYGQLIIDEFVLSEIRSGNNWWGNKYGIQAGVKLFDLMNVKGLFGRIEYNLVRPYTYSYSNSIINYGNHYQALAHPSGANFKELLFQLHYHKNRYLIELKGIFSQAGLDTDSVSYGKDIYKSYELRQDDYGNVQGQGIKGQFLDLSLSSAYYLNPKAGLQIHFSINYRELKLANSSIESPFVLIGIRTLLHNYRQDYF